MKYLFALYVFAALSFAQSSATQSDWSGGPVQPGPVTTWGNAFSTGSNLVWSVPGLVNLVYGIMERTVDSSINSPSTVYAADIDGDVFLDIVAAGYNANSVIWYENTLGSGAAWTERLIDGGLGGAYSVFSADINGDGKMDVVAAGISSSDVVWYENYDGTGLTWLKRNVDTNFSGAMSACAADIDDDGDLDVIGGAFNGNMVSWWENTNGSGTAWTEHVVDGSFSQACWVRTADVDGDGFMDVLGASRNADDMTWWENVNGSGLTWTEHTIDGSYDGPTCIQPADIDGDGDVDVVGSATNANSITWWQNVDGSGLTWSEKTITGSFSEAYCAYPGDMDGDGDQDVISASQALGDVVWWDNLDGVGGAWTQHVLENDLAGSRTAIPADLDMDGRMDVVAAGFNAQRIMCWDLGAYPPNGILESSILDTGTDPDWGILLWSTQSPAGTSVWFQVRASDNSSSMGAWSDTIYAPGNLGSYIADGGRYVQYRAILNAFTHNATPSLLDMTMTWTGTGIEGGPDAAADGLLPFIPNPQQGIVQAAFALTQPSTAALAVFDLSGRIVAWTEPAEYASGSHQLQLGELQPGVYLCRLTAGDLIDSRLFVVVEQ